MSDFFKRIISAISSFFLAIAAFFHLAPTPQPGTDHGRWLLDNLPAYSAGQYCETLYDTGTGFENEVLSAAQQKSYMQLVRDTTLQDALDYGQRLAAQGFRQTFSNWIGQTYSFAYQSDAQRVYYTFNETSKEARVIDDCCNTASLDAFGYDTAPQPEPVTEPPEVTTEPVVDEPFDPQETQVNGDNEPTAPTDTPTEPTQPVSTTAPYYAPDDFTLRPGVYQFTFPYYDERHNDSERYAKNGMLYVILLR